MQEYFDFLWKQTEDCLYIFDMRGAEDIRLYQANPAGLGYLKKTGGNPVGEPLAALFEPAGCEEIQRACRRCLDNGGVSRCSMPVQDEQGDRLYLDVSLTAFHHDNETMIIFWGKDITPSMRLRQQREALLREYDRLFSCSVAGIGLVRLSPNAAPVLERSNGTFNRFVSLIQTSPQYGDWNALFLDNIRQGIDSTRQVFFDINAQNRYFDVDILFIRENGVPLKAFVLVVNTTELVTLEKRGKANLTRREREILQLISKGSTNKSIAHTLGIAEGTVKKTIYNAYQKLQIQSRAEAVKYILSERENSL